MLPYCLMTLLVSNLALAGHFYRVMLSVQIGVYAAALVGLVTRRDKVGLLRLPAAFLLLNAASVVAAARWLSGAEDELWRGGNDSSPERSMALR